MPTPSSEKFEIEGAAARSFIYHWLSLAFSYPNPETWRWLTDSLEQDLLNTAVRELSDETLVRRVEALILQLRPERYESLRSSYVEAFGHAARGRHPINEIEYGDLKADPLFQPHRLADLAAYYRAFGLEVSSDATERHDHLGSEMEFMSVLAMKEAYALENRLGAEALSVCRDAQKNFLREHLASWTPAFSRRLARAWEGGLLGLLADFLNAFVQVECGTHGIRPGRDDMLLRPVDDSAEKLCDSCGLARAMPGECSTGGEG